MRFRGVGLIFLAACENQIAWTSARGASSGIIATRTNEGLRIEAVDADTVWTEDAGEVLEVHALWYRKELAELGVASGPLTASAEGGRLPLPDRIEVLRNAAFVEIERLPDDLRDLSIAESCPCLSPTIVRGEVSVAGSLLYGVPTGGDEVVLGTSESSFLATAPRAIPFDAPFPARAAAPGQRGEIWLANTRRIAHGVPGSALIEAPELPIEGARIAWIDASKEGPSELFAITSSLAIAHFDGESWSVLREAPEAPEARSRPMIAWAGPGQAVAIGHSRKGLREITLGEPIRDEYLLLNDENAAAPESLYSVSWLAGFDAVLGSRYGRVAFKKQGVWTLLPHPPDDARVEGLAGLEGGGIWSGGQRGRFNQWFEGYGFCRPEAGFAAGHDPVAVVPVPGALTVWFNEEGRGVGEWVELARQPCR
ncbi:MAG: hypothetical protein HYV07_23415 [Deltaproteobacteria bacterium]|nr:hypothetical protein [Deltaproteobacteria bacterium]